MRILALTYERGWEIEKDHDIMYADINGIESIGWKEALKEVIQFDPDIVIEREFNDGRALYMPLLHDLKQAKPSIIRTKWFIDTHVQKKLHQLYSNVIDIGFFAISKSAEEFKEYLGEDNSFWLPLCYPYRSDTINPNYNEIKYPISFVGRWGKKLGFERRTDLIHVLHNRYGSKFHSVTDYDNMLSILKRSKIGFNCSLAGDLNFRVFETLGAGTELVTDDGAEDLFKIEGLTDYLWTYNTQLELFDFIDKILVNDPNYTHNQLQAQKFIKNKHCLVNRLESLLEMVDKREQVKY
jgi:hypothetical protein